MDEDRERIIEPILSSQNNDDGFKKIKTIPIFSVHLLISSAISLTGIILAICWKDQDRCKAYFIMMYLRVCFWFITFIFDHIVKIQHEDVRLNGYHEFYRSTSMHKGVPIYIVSLWNSVILGIQTLLSHYYGPNFWEKCIQMFLSPIVYITMFSALETLVFAGIHSSYIARIMKFNKSQQPPDALRGNHILGGSVGLTQRGADVIELLEKQADLINYLKDQNLNLNKKLMQLNSQMRNSGIS